MSHAISCSPFGASTLTSSGFTGLRGAFGGAAAVSATQTRDLALSITTDEGDVVTLTLHQASEVGAASYRDVARHGHGRRAQVATASFERSVGLSVQGDLNARERADILALAKDLRQVAKAFFQDHLDAAKQALAQFDELGSLQSFTFEASRTQDVSVLVRAGAIARSPALPVPVQPLDGGADAALPGAGVPGRGTAECGEAGRA